MPQEQMPQPIPSQKFLEFLSAKARNHLSNFATQNPESGSELLALLADITQRVTTHFANLSTEDVQLFATKLVSYFRQGAQKTETGTFQSVDFYTDLIIDSIQEVGQEDFLERRDTLSIFECVQRHQQKKAIKLDEQFETDKGLGLKRDLLYFDARGKEHSCSLIKATEGGHLKRAGKYASKTSHVCIGDDDQGYISKLNQPTSQNGIEVYFLWEDDGSEGGLYHQIIAYSKKSKKIEQMKGVDSGQVNASSIYLPALGSAIKYLKGQGVVIKSIADTGSIEVGPNHVFTIAGDILPLEDASPQNELVRGDVDLSQYTDSEARVRAAQYAYPEYDITRHGQIAATPEEITIETKIYLGDLEPKDWERFQGAKNLKYVHGDVNLSGSRVSNIPEGLTFNGSAIFSDCVSLAVIPQGTIFNMGANFHGCLALSAISPGVMFNGSNPGPKIYFSGCSSLTTIPEGMVFNGRHMFFNGCTSLVTLPPGVVFNGGVEFFGCTLLATISPGVVFNKGATFINCSSLTTIPEGIMFKDVSFVGCPIDVQTVSMLEQMKLEGKIDGRLSFYKDVQAFLPPSS